MSTQLLIEGFEWFLIALVVFVAYLIVSIFLALLRNIVALGILNNVFAFFGVLLARLNRVGRWFSDQLGQLVTWAWRGLKHAWERIGEQSIANNLGSLDVLSASGFFVLLLILVTSDAYFAAIRLPQLFGLPSLNLNITLFNAVLVFYWVSMIIVIAATCADAWGLTHLLPPYVGVRGARQRALRIAALVVVGLLLLAGLLQGLFSWELTSGVSLPLVDGTLNGLLFLLGFIATAAVGVSAPYEFLAFLVIVPSLLRLIPTLIALILDIPLAMLDKIAALIVSIYDAIAFLGYNVWNWISDKSRTRWWSVGKMPDFKPRPDISN